ncbi:MAG TPA: PEP-CTERM sorting domain-containing protein, partial [Pirellulales bacterium]|nr:PEP-CTERM sorting domain-containing protein [Pirellulales bacterium]
VGWLNPNINGAGLVGNDYVTFEIDRQGLIVFQQTFTNNAALLSFFTSSVLDLGPENAGLTGGTLNLEFKFDFSSATSGAGFSTGLAFGNAVLAPEPSSSVLLALGICGLLGRAAALRLRSKRRN